MKAIYILFIAVLFRFRAINAQQHKIVWDMSSKDTAEQAIIFARSVMC